MQRFKILVSEQKAHQNEKIIAALAEGLGAKLYKENTLRLKTQDVLLTFGVGNHHFHPLIRQHMKGGGLWVEANYGWFGQRGRYGRLTLNGLVPPYHPTVPMSEKRWNALGLKFQRWRQPSGGGPYLLVLPHTESIAAFTGVPRDMWLQEVSRRATAAGLQVRIRKRYCQRPKEEDLAGACGVYAFNSALALEALLKGIPALGDPRGHILGRGQEAAPEKVRERGCGSRWHLFSFLAMCQGSLEELATPGFARDIIKWQHTLHTQQGGQV
jgi:hypothetical protein